VAGHAAAPAAIPLDTAAILRRALALYGANFLRMVVIAAMVMVPALFAELLLPGLSQVTVWIAGPVTIGALVLAFDRLAAAEPITVGSSLLDGLGSLPRLLVAGFVYDIAVVLPMALLVLLATVLGIHQAVLPISIAIVLAALFLFTNQAIVLEESGPIAAFTRSRQLLWSAQDVAVPLIAVAAGFGLAPELFAIAAVVGGAPEAYVIGARAIGAAICAPLQVGIVTLFFLAARAAYRGEVARGTDASLAGAAA